MDKKISLATGLALLAGVLFVGGCRPSGSGEITYGRPGNVYHRPSAPPCVYVPNDRRVIRFGERRYRPSPSYRPSPPSRTPPRRITPYRRR